MQPFDYMAPSTLKEALKVLGQANGLVKLLAGGTDLIAQIKERRIVPSIILDVKQIPEVNRLEFNPDKGLRIGAAVSCTDVARYTPTQANYPSLAEACLLIGSIQIQNRGSVGGNICNAAPSADTIPPLLTFNASAIISGPGGTRQVPLEDFFLGPGKTVLGPQELLIEVWVPPPTAHSYSSYLRFIPREEMDIAIAGVGSLISMDPDTSLCSSARIALAAVAPTPIRARKAEQSLIGNPLTKEAIESAAELAASASSPITDVRSSAAYRKKLIKVLTRRTLSQCKPL